MNLQKISTLLTRLVLSIFLLLCGTALLLGVSQSTTLFSAFCIAALFVIPLRYLWPIIVSKLAKLGCSKNLLLLTALCFVVKLIWVLAVRVPPTGDYAVFWGYATSLAKQEVIWGGRYIALFPHIFGYSSFLSFFIRLLGSGAMLAQMLNIFLTICSGIFLFKLCYRWLNLHAAISVYLLWIACPSQTIYNSLILSEPLYTTLMLAFLWLVTAVPLAMEKTKKPIIFASIAGVIGGVLLRAINAARPIAAIWIIALVLWLFCLNLHRIRDSAIWRVWLPGITLLLGIYLLSGPMWNAHIARRIGEEPARTPGYSMLVGFNKNSGGGWNQSDSDRLYFYSDMPGATAQWAQEQVRAEAKERIASDNIDYSQFFSLKLKTFLGSDDSCVYYCAPVLRHTEEFSLLCNIFFYLSLLLAIAGAIKLWKNRVQSSYLLVPIFILGLTLAQMLVEVAGRYHYSIIPMLLLIGQSALFAENVKCK